MGRKTFGAVAVTTVLGTGLCLAALGCDSHRALQRLFGSTGPAQPSQAPFDDEGRERVVTKHNELRSRLARGNVPNQPPAADMNLLAWDEELARVSQAWAEQCTFAHNEDRQRQYAAATNSDQPVGENIFIYSGPGEDLDIVVDGVQAWFDEHTEYSYGTEYVPAAGHYMQLVWADTTRVGCGYATCDEVQGAAMRDGIVFVCNYLPAGNMVGEAPYASGPACSQCDESRAGCVQGLCTTNPG